MAFPGGKGCFIHRLTGHGEGETELTHLKLALFPLSVRVFHNLELWEVKLFAFSYYKK